MAKRQTCILPNKTKQAVKTGERQKLTGDQLPKNNWHWAYLSAQIEIWPARHSILESI